MRRTKASLRLRYMTGIDSLMTVGYWRLPLFIKNVILDYTYKPDFIHWASEQRADEPKYNIVKNSWLKFNPKKIWILHGADYYLMPGDISDMIVKLFKDKKAHSIGLHPCGPRLTVCDQHEEFTHTRRIVIYKAEVMREFFDEGIKKCISHMHDNFSDWTGFVNEAANEAGYHPLQATRARMFYLNDDPRFYKHIPDVHGMMTGKVYP